MGLCICVDFGVSQAVELLRFLISDDFQSGRSGAMMSFVLAILVDNVLHCTYVI